MNKNKLYKLLEKEIPFEPNYNSIKDKINFYDCIENNSFKRNKYIFLKLLLTTFIILFAIGVYFACFFESKTKYIESEIITYANDNDFIENYEYVFIAKVKKLIDTKPYNGTGTDIPFTFYEFEHICFLKGKNNKENSLLCFYGGKSKFNTYELLKNNDVMLKENKYYLFFANTKSKKSNNDRINENDFIISDNNQKILLEGYDNSKLYNEQNRNVQVIINRYSNIINKSLRNEILNIYTYDNLNNLIDSFNYVTIIQINNQIARNSSGEGINSEIVSTIYNIEVLEYLKGNFQNTDHRLYCYGVNFWEQEKKFKHYISPLKEDKVYLLIANKIENNSDNTRTNIGDFVAMDNYQIIELNNYNKDLHYSKQSKEILDIITEYLIYI